MKQNYLNLLCCSGFVKQKVQNQKVKYLLDENSTVGSFLLLPRVLK